MKLSKSPYLKRFFLFSGILLIFGVVAVALFFRPNEKLFPDYGNIVKFDPAREGGHLLPNLNVEIQGEKRGQRVTIVTNSKGFRNDREFTYEVPDKTIRILLLGDSFIDGMRTDQKDTIGFILEQTLKKGKLPEWFQNVEVLISGHNNPFNALYYYQEHGRRYHPQIVILGFTIGNDITWTSYLGAMQPVEDVQNEFRLRYQPGFGQSTRRSLPLLLPKDAYIPPSRWREFFQNVAFHWREILAKRFYTFAYMVPPILVPQHSVRRRVYAADFCVGLGLFYQPAMPSISIRYKEAEDVLRGFKQQVRMDGQRFMVVLFPVRMQVYSKEWDLLVRFYALNEKKFDLNYPNSRFKRFFDKENVDCLDLLPVFKAQEKTNGKPLFRPRGDMHFNELGQRLAAVHIAKHVIERLVGEERILGAK